MLFALVKKDLVQELRTKEGIVFTVSLCLLFAVIIALGINSAMVSSNLVQRLFPSLWWISFIFTATCAMGRNLESDLEHMGVEGLLLAGVSSSTLYLSKFVSSMIVMFLGLLLSLIALSVLLNVSILPFIAPLLIISILAIVSYAALATLVIGISSSSPVKSLILPLILLPLLFPIFFAATELTAQLFSTGTLDPLSLWLSLLLGLDVLYIVLGVNLYEHVIRE